MPEINTILFKLLSLELDKHNYGTAYSSKFNRTMDFKKVYDDVECNKLACKLTNTSFIVDLVLLLENIRVTALNNFPLVALPKIMMQIRKH